MTLFFWMSTRLFRFFFRVFYSLRVYGVDNITRGGAIIAPNHASFFDPPIICAAWPEETHYLARKSLFDKPLLRGLISRLNAHPVTGTAQDLNSIKVICELLNQHQKVVIFPEGERSDDGELTEIKTGIAMLAMRCHCPIIPAYIHGTYDVWPKQRRWPKLRGKIACVFGKPIFPDEFSSLTKKEAQIALAARVFDDIQALKHWYLLNIEKA